MLNWSRIDNDKTFQQLINHLASLECRSPGFLPSSPYIGPDGGYDAYTDHYFEEGLSGHICIQAKYTKHSNKEAFEYLQTEIPKELTKAKKNNATHLIIATNADLSVPYLQKLLALNTDKQLSLYIWARATLTLKIEKQPFLRSYFFNSPAIVLFVPSSVYFEEAGNDLLEITASLTNQIKSIKDRISEFVAFLTDQSKKIFVIHAPGGYGKSHFLRELAQVTNATKTDREVWFIRRGVRNIKEAFADEIAVRETDKSKHKYVIVLDDTDRADDIKELIECVMNSGIDIRLVLSSRTSGVSMLESALISAGRRPDTAVSEIPQWSVEELIMLLRSVSGQNPVKDEDLIVRAYPNPFFVVKIAQNIKKAGSFDFESIRQIILQSLIRDTRSILTTKQSSLDAKALLLHLSLISPFNSADRSTGEKLAQKLGVKLDELKAIIDLMVEKRVLRKIGELIRFIPDMIGDVFLLDEMQSLGEEARRDCFLYWFDTHSKNIFCNLGATLKYGEDTYLKKIIADVISNWTQNSTQYDSHEKRQILDNLEEICYIAPEKTMDLLYAFLQSQDLTSDEYGPVVIALLRSNCSREEVVKLMIDLREKSKTGTYDNYKPYSLIKSAVSPLYNSIEKKILPTLAALSDFLNHGGEAKNADLLKTALEEVLAGSHEYTESNYRSITHGSRALNANLPVLAMRNKAIEILKRMLKDSRAQVRTFAIDVIEDIGRLRLGGGSSRIPLQDKIDSEGKEMLDFVKSNNLIDQEKEYTVLSAYEDWLFSWWARQEVSDEEILPLMDKFPADPEYRIFRYYVSRWDIDIEGNIIEKLRSAPSKDRWPWAVDNIMERKWHLKVEDFHKDAIFINEKYKTPQSIVEYLNNLYKKVSVSSANALFLRAWVKINPANFRVIREDKTLWKQTPRLFKFTISYDLAHHYSDLAQQILDEIIKTDQFDLDEARIALDILSYDLPIDKIKTIKDLVKKGIPELNELIVEKLRFIGEKFTPEEMGEALLIALRGLNFEQHPRLTDHVAFILHGKTTDYRDKFLKIVHDVLFEMVVKSKKLDYHDLEILSFIIKDAKELIDFIEKRLEVEKAINSYSGYKAIPYDGITTLEKIIKSEADYFLAVDRALLWEGKYEGVVTFSVSEIFEQIVSLQDGAAPYFEKLLDRFKDKGEFPKLLKCLEKLPLITANLEIFKKVIKLSENHGLEDEVGKILRSKVYPEGGWSSSGDEAPPAFVEKKNIFVELKKNVSPGKLRNVIDQCLDSAEKSINEHKIDEDNYFHSR
jgi:hypothetical protein